MKPLFAPDESITTARLRLTSVTAADLESLPWIPTALAPEFTLADLIPHVEAGYAVLISRCHAEHSSRRSEELRESVRGEPGRTTQRPPTSDRKETVDTPIGMAVALMDLPGPGLASIPLIAIDPAHRFRGLGGEAGLALESHIAERWAPTAILAPIPEGRGLAVYFWLRLGYAPLTQADAPWPVQGLAGKVVPGIWMRREV